MKRSILGVAVAGLLFGAAAPWTSVHAQPSSPGRISSVAVCPVTPARGQVTCFARALTVNGTRARPRVSGTGAPDAAASTTAGYSPADIRAAYNLPPIGPSPTVALIEAYDDPNAEADLGVYRSRFGLAPCTTANGCFRKTDQVGGYALPQPDSGWATETSLDLQAVSAACPSCHLLLVEAASSDFVNIGTAVNTAVGAGATEVSLSLGAAEFTGERQLDPSYNHPGVAIVASAGDSGYGAQYPAASPYVTAVGGTSLLRDSSARGWSESVWGPTGLSPGGTGSGCSAMEPKPSWQHDLGCSSRTIADVAADADPTTGLAVYDSYGSGGWIVAGGTSLSAPVIAAAYALGGGEGAASGAAPLYAAPRTYDITTGSNSVSPCQLVYLCTAEVGYDGPTGLGTPNGPPLPAAPSSAPPPVPVASSPLPNTLVAVEGTDNAVYIKLAGGNYADLGGQTLAAPAVASLPNQIHLVVVLGTDHNLYQRTENLNWRLVTSQPTYCLDNPAVVTGAGGATIACQGSDHALYVNNGSLDSTGIFHAGYWQRYGGYLTSGPAIALDSGQMHFFVDGINGQVYDRTATTGYSARPWVCVGHPAVSASGSTTVFGCHGTDNQLWSATDRGQGFGGARPLGGQLADGIGAATTGGGTTFYIEGPNLHVYSLTVDTGGTPTGTYADNGGLAVHGAGATGP